MNLWRKIFHMYLNIYMSDRTIAENIALGYSKNNINIDRLNEASKEAEIYDFINSLENKYNSAMEKSKAVEDNVRELGLQEHFITIQIY